MTENKAQTNKKTLWGGGRVALMFVLCWTARTSKKTNKYGKSTKREKEEQF
jgi:hypothetical protein